MDRTYIDFSSEEVLADSVLSIIEAQDNYCGIRANYFDRNPIIIRDGDDFRFFYADDHDANDIKTWTKKTPQEAKKFLQEFGREYLIAFLKEKKFGPAVAISTPAAVAYDREAVEFEDNLNIAVKNIIAAVGGIKIDDTKFEYRRDVDLYRVTVGENKNNFDIDTLKSYLARNPSICQRLANPAVVSYADAPMAAASSASSAVSIGYIAASGVSGSGFVASEPSQAIMDLLNYVKEFPASCITDTTEGPAAGFRIRYYDAESGNFGYLFPGEIVHRVTSDMTAIVSQILRTYRRDDNMELVLSDLRKVKSFDRTFNQAVDKLRTITGGITVGNNQFQLVTGGEEGEEDLFISQNISNPDDWKWHTTWQLKKYFGQDRSTKREMEAIATAPAPAPAVDSYTVLSGAHYRA